MSKHIDTTDHTTTEADQALLDLARALAATEAQAQASATKRKDRKAAAPRERHECACGCGSLTWGAWAPGHDGVLTGVAVRAAKGGATSKGGPRVGDAALLARYGTQLDAIRAASAHHATLVERALQAVMTRTKAA